MSHKGSSAIFHSWAQRGIARFAINALTLTMEAAALRIGARAWRSSTSVCLLGETWRVFFAKNPTSILEMGP